MNPSKGEKPPFMMSSRSHSCRYQSDIALLVPQTWLTHLGKEDILQPTSLLIELLVQRGIPNKEVLEYTAVRCVRHDKLRVTAESLGGRWDSEMIRIKERNTIFLLVDDDFSTPFPSAMM